MAYSTWYKFAEEKQFDSIVGKMTLATNKASELHCMALQYILSHLPRLSSLGERNYLKYLLISEVCNAWHDTDH